jgi:hypothetical protein
MRAGSPLCPLNKRARLRARRAAAAAAGFAHDPGAAAKRHRARVLCEWLLGAFGRDALNASSGVVDVAGAAAARMRSHTRLSLPPNARRGRHRGFV